MIITMINGQNHKGSTYEIGKILADDIAGDKEIYKFFLPRDLNHFCTVKEFYGSYFYLLGVSQTKGMYVP